MYASFNTLQFKLNYWNPGSLACSVIASLILCIPLGLSLVILSARKTGVQLIVTFAVLTVVIYYGLGYLGPRLYTFGLIL